MPESPKTRYRRPRAANVTAADRGRLSGPETTRDPPAKVRLPGPQRPTGGNPKVEAQVNSELRPQHQWRIRWGPDHGTYRAWCTCGTWELASPARMLRARTTFKDHVRRVVAAEVIRRRRAAGELRGVGQRRRPKPARTTNQKGHPRA
jgi:hypothetical protein